MSSTLSKLSLILFTFLNFLSCSGKTSPKKLGYDERCTHLILAAKSKDFKFIERLLKQVLEDNQSLKQEVLDKALNEILNPQISNFSELLSFITKRNRERRMNIAETLLKLGANPNASYSGYPILISCILLEMTSAIKLLIKFGADVNIKCIYGKTALQRAKETKNREIINLLLQNKAK